MAAACCCLLLPAAPHPLLAGQAFSDAELTSPRFSVAAGHTWSAVNGNARRWMLAAHGLGLQGRYSLAR